MKIYYKHNVDSIHEDLELSEKQHFTINVDNEECTYFNGFADVYDATIFVFESGNETNGATEYECEITHEALAYYCNGE